MLTLLIATGVVGTSGSSGGGSPALSLALVKQHLRVRHSDEDALISAYLAAAVAHVEKVTSRLLTRRAVTQELLNLCEPVPILWGPDPVIAEDQGLAYFDTAGDPALVSDLRLKALRAYPPVDGWPATMDFSPLTLTYTAGHGDGEGEEPLPADLINALLLLTEHFYVNRGASSENIPQAVTDLCQPYRRFFV